MLVCAHCFVCMTTRHNILPNTDTVDQLSALKKFSFYTFRLEQVQRYWFCWNKKKINTFAAAAMLSTSHWNVYLCAYVCVLVSVWLCLRNVARLNVSHLYRVLLRYSSISLIVVVRLPLLFLRICHPFLSFVDAGLCLRRRRRRVRVLLSEQLCTTAYEMLLTNTKRCVDYVVWRSKKKDGHRLVVFVNRIVSTSVLYRPDINYRLCIIHANQRSRFALVRQNKVCV